MNKNEKRRFWFGREGASYWGKKSTKKYLNITKNNTQIRQNPSLKYVGYILYDLMEVMTLNVLIQTNFELSFKKNKILHCGLGTLLSSLSIKLLFG